MVWKVSMFLLSPQSSDLGGKLPFEAGISLFLGAEYEDILQKYKRSSHNVENLNLELVPYLGSHHFVCRCRKSFNGDMLSLCRYLGNQLDMLQVWKFQLVCILTRLHFSYLISFVFPFCFASGPLSTCDSY